MGWFLLIMIILFGFILSFGSGKAQANFSGEHLCVFCHKRLKWAGNRHYATVCPRCGRSQPRESA
jgi:predicted amidophosphoribosyltransferase